MAESEIVTVRPFSAALLPYQIFHQNSVHRRRHWPTRPVPLLLVLLVQSCGSRNHREDRSFTLAFNVEFFGVVVIYDNQVGYLGSALMFTRGSERGCEWLAALKRARGQRYARYYGHEIHYTYSAFLITSSYFSTGPEHGPRLQRRQPSLLR